MCTRTIVSIESHKYSSGFHTKLHFLLFLPSACIDTLHMFCIKLTMAMLTMNELFKSCVLVILSCFLNQTKKWDEMEETACNVIDCIALEK